MASVTDIKAVSYDVCGVVQIDSAGFKAKVDPQFLSSNFVTYNLPVNSICCHVCFLGSFDSWARECQTSSQTDRWKWKFLL